MRTTIRIDDEIVKETMILTKAKNTNRAIVIAVESFVRDRGTKGLLDLFGKVKIEDNWKELRNAELKE
ncbi:MAG: type II toxin-antitoxin system VapB family antitoxin [bacterium]|nr:type II toxin-antitoxin system VapB family antitoxin [bacterium]